MLELKNELFMTSEFPEAIKKILACDSLSPKVALKWLRAAKEIEAQNKLYDEVRIRLLSKYGTQMKDDKGNFNGSYSIIPDNIPTFSKEFNELCEQTFTINYEKMEYPADLKLSPLQMNLMEEFFDFSTLEK